MLRQGWVCPFALAAVLVAYNNVFNLWPSFHRRLYVPLNLVMTSAVLMVGIGLMDLNLEAMGLGSGQTPAILAGAISGLLFTLPLLLAIRHPRAAGAIADRRLAGFGRISILNRVFIRVPLGTALPEEIAFRGVLYAAFSSFSSGGPLFGAVLSSAAFALWHVAPSWNLANVNRLAPVGPRGGWVKRLTLLAGAVALAFTAGMLLVWLRIRFGGIGAPLALHATVNSLASVASYLALRRAKPD